MKTLLRIILLVVLAAVAALAWRQRPVTVATVQPEVRVMTETVVATGRVNTERSPVVRAETDGLVRRLAVEGDMVRAGQAVAELEDPDGELLAGQAEAALNDARLAVSQLEAQDRPQADLQRRQAALLRDQARRRLDDLNGLQARQDVALANLAESREALAQAENALAQAELRLAALGANGVEARRRAATLARAEASARLAALRRERAVARAPAAGTVLQRLVQPGDRVRSGDPLLLLAAAGEREVTADLDERWLPLLAPGQSAMLVADAWPDRPFPAAVTRIAPSVDTGRGTVRVRLRAAAWPDFVREGMTLSVQLGGARAQPSRLLPVSALATVEGRSGVWRVRDGRAVFQPVQTGRRDADGRVEITAGLEAGEAVIREAAAIHDGQHVRTVRP